MTRARDLAKLANPEVFSVDSNNNVGLSSETPDAKFDVIGVVSATSYRGDGSQLSGIVPGSTLSASNGTQRLVVTSQTTGAMTEVATNSDITYDTGTSTLSATQFSGTLLGNATGLQGTPNINVQDIAAQTVSVGGTLTCAEIGDINAVGSITANSGVNVTGILTTNNLDVTSTSTFSDKVTIGTPGIGITLYESGNADFDGDVSISDSLVVNGNNYPSTGSLSNRNLIINGAITIDQRNFGGSFTPSAADTAFYVDRWGGYNSDGNIFSTQQVTGVGSTNLNYEANSNPPGFVNSIKFTSLSAFSLSSMSQSQLRHTVEKRDVAKLYYGTSSAVSLILSFWVKSSLTGTFGGSFRNSNIDSPSNYRSLPFSYSINSANTWENKTIIVPGDTDYETGNNPSGGGISLTFAIMVGSNFIGGSDNVWSSGNYLASSSVVNITETNGATFYLSGVQLEVGSKATPFEHESYGETLQKCKRFYQYVPKTRGSARGSAIGTDQCAFSHNLGVEMCHIPTVSRVPTSSAGCTHQQYINVSETHIAATVDVTSTSYWFYNDGYIADADF